MFAPVEGRALPLSTPQPVVCGQLPSSQSPTIGMAIAVRDKIVWSDVNNHPHTWRMVVVKVMAKMPTTTAQKRATNMAIRALCGLLAPSSLPILVETARLSEEGNM